MEFGFFPSRGLKKKQRGGVGNIICLCLSVCPKKALENLKVASCCCRWLVKEEEQRSDKPKKRGGEAAWRLREHIQP